MRSFTQLYEDLDGTTATAQKVEAMATWLGQARPDDAAWAAFVLSGRKVQRLVKAPDLAQWAAQAAGLPGWLFGEAASGVGDLAETIALVLDTAGVLQTEPPDTAPDSLAFWMTERLLPLKGMPPDAQHAQLLQWWRRLPRAQVFVLGKLLTGELRVGVSQLLLERAIAKATGLPNQTISQRLMGPWQPDAATWQALVAPEGQADEPSRPYPFFLASPLEQPVESLGNPQDWLAEWKWDGIRCQLVKRQGQVWLWSRGEELVTERFPEITQAAQGLADGTVLDGEILAWRDGVAPGSGLGSGSGSGPGLGSGSGPGPGSGSGSDLGSDGTPLGFQDLQLRIGKLNPSAKLQQKVPVALLCYDLLEHQGHDIRDMPLRDRRLRLEALVPDRTGRLRLSRAVVGETWADLAVLREESRERGVEGLMLKALESPYRIGRRRGDWWKWKVDPYTVDAVLIYAEAGRGKRAHLYTAYTFAVWHEGALVPVARAYSGLDNAEIEELDRWIRRHTLERFGPVRSVAIEHVFELAFEGIQASPRHKAGVAVRFPRILRWRHDKKPQDADTLATLQALLRVP